MDKSNEFDPQPLRVAAKWGPPVLVAAVPRWRLFKRLVGLGTFPCVWVQAPAGYGKTYFLSSFLKDLGRHSFWYNLDEGDSDVAAFFSDLSAAAASAGLGSLPRFSPEVQAIGRFGRLYFHQLAGAVGEPTVLVLDDYHRVAQDSRLHDAIADALEHLPATLRIVVLSREAPPPAFARAVSHLKIGLIDADAMALTDEEALAIAHKSEHRPISDDAVGAARRQVAGWAAGFVLLVRQTDPTVLAPSSVATLNSYFEYEVLRPASAAIRKFLWQTAIFPSMTTSMAERLTGRPDAAQLLTELSGANYFLYAGQPPAAAYHYHDLFRDFLLQYGHKESPERWVETARRAAEILAELGDSEPSAEIYASLSDWNGLAGLIGRCSPQWLKRGSYRTLEHWLSMLPADLKESDPWLLYWGGCAHLARNPREARDSLQRAFAMFAAKGEIRGALLAWAATCQAFFLAFDDLRPLGDWLERLHALVPSPESIPKELEARIAPGAFLCLMVARPADPEISHWEKILWRLVESDPDANLSAMAAPLLALHFAYTIGDRARSLRLREALRALQQTERMAPVSMVMLRGFSEVVFEFGFGGSTSHILKTLRGAMDLVQSRGVRLYDASLYGALAYCHLAAGGQREAGEALEQMARVMDWERKWDVGFYFEMRAWDAWLDGRYTEAWDLAQQAIVLKDNFGMMHARPVAHMAAVQTANSLGRRAKAFEHLAAVRQWTHATGSRIGHFMRGVALAHLALERGRRARARRLLKVTLQLGQVEGFVSSHFFRREDLAALCAEALDADIGRDYAVRIIRSRELPPPAKMEHAERWPWPVRVYTLGGFRLELDSTTQDADQKVQQKPVELLKALVAEGGESVPHSRLADLLWPEADGDMAAHSFKTTLSRLRKLLGRNDFLVVQDGRLSLNRQFCWIDTWRLDEVTQVTAEAAQPGAPTPTPAAVEALIGRLRRAYPAPLLPDDAADWVDAYRSRIHRRYERCLAQLSQLMERAGPQRSRGAALLPVMDL